MVWGYVGVGYEDEFDKGVECLCVMCEAIMNDVNFSILSLVYLYLMP